MSNETALSHLLSLAQSYPTGAGKSTIAQSLFRLVDITEGSIIVDGINLKDVDRDTLRQQLCVIPQESFLFSGKMRDNLDPMGIFSDAQMNEALGQCGLIGGPEMSNHMVQRLEKFKLDSEISSKGQTFSWVLAVESA